MSKISGTVQRTFFPACFIFFILVADIILSSSFYVDLSFVVGLLGVCIYLLRSCQPIFAIFVLILVFWFYFPRFFWLNKAYLFDSTNYLSIIVLVSIFMILMLPLLIRRGDVQSSGRQRYVLYAYIPIFFVSTAFQISNGSYLFENDIDSSFGSFLAYIPSSLLPYLVVLLAFEFRLRKIWKAFILFVFGAVLIFKGSKFILFTSLLLPLTVYYLYQKALSAYRLLLLLLAALCMLTISVSVGVLVRYGLTDMHFIDSLPDILVFTIDLVIGRLNFAAIIDSSTDYWGSHFAEVYHPLIWGLLPRVLFPDRPDLNNGQWFGALIGVLEPGSNAYVAATLFNDLLLGGSIFLASIALFSLFLTLRLFRFVLFKIFRSDDIFLVFFLVNVLLRLEMNFAFILIGCVKSFFVLIIALAIPMFFLRATSLWAK